MTDEGPVPTLRLPSARKVLVAFLILAVVVAGVLVYVVTTTDPEVRGIEPLGVAPFEDDRIRPGPHDARYSPDGRFVAVLTGGRVGIAEEGQVRPVTESGSNVVDFAWFPGSNALLVAEGPTPTGGLAVIEPDGRVRGTIPLDPPVGFGNGHGMDVSPGGREAVVTAVIRPALGEEQRYLVHVDLETGKVRQLTEPDAISESTPFWLDTETIAFTRETPEGPRVELIDENGVSRGPVRLAEPEARTVGTLDGEWVVVSTGRRLLALRFDGRQAALGVVPAGAGVVAVHPDGTSAIVAETVESVTGTAVQLRNIALDPPGA